jgi:hypothetical protein
MVGPMSYRWLGFCVYFGLCACAIAPLPDQVTGYSTPQIVERIRCEAREAVREKLGITLQALGQNNGDKNAEDIGTAILNDSVDIKTVSLTSLGKPLKDLILRYADTAIAYNFSFDGTEMNNLDSGTLGITRGLIDGMKMLGFTGSVDRSRENIQNFTVSDTFVGLLRDVKPEYCNGRTPHGPNYLYPIAGKVGIGKVVDDFVDLDFFGNLGGPVDTPTGPPTLATNLTFTTTISASATPSITLNPIVDATRITSGALTAMGERMDVHRLIVAISRPVDAPSAAVAVKIFGGQIITPTGTLTEQRAQLAIQQNIIRYELNNQRNTVILNQPLLPF